MLSDQEMEDLERQLETPFTPTEEEAQAEKSLSQMAEDLFQQQGKNRKTAKDRQRGFELQDLCRSKTGIVIKCTREVAIKRQVHLWHILTRQTREARKRDRDPREARQDGASSDVLQENLVAEDDAPVTFPRNAGHHALLVFVAGAGTLKGKPLCSLKELQLACLALCEAVRDLPPFLHLVVGWRALDTTKLRRGSTRGRGQQQQEDMKSRIPSRVSAEAAEEAAASPRPEKVTSRVPLLLGKSIEWCFHRDEMLKCTYALSTATSLQLGTRNSFTFHGTMDMIVWPPNLETLEFGDSFNQSVAGVTWPSSLAEMTFGESFDHHDITNWPENLQRLMFTGDVHWFLGTRVWPKSLTHLSLMGRSCIAFPDELPQSLTHLFFGDFNEPIYGRMFPALLQELSLGDRFDNYDKPITEAIWPASLLRLSFGDQFNQPIVGVAWPDDLEELSFGTSFQQDLREVVWPSRLKRLELGGFTESLAGISWPQSLTYLSLDDDFDQPIHGQHFPDGLQQLSFGMRFNQPISEVIWPASLLRLTFGDLFNQPAVGTTWPAGLQELSFGPEFDQDLSEAVWPTCMRRLNLGGFNQSIAEVSWPDSLLELRFTAKFNKDLAEDLTEIKWPAYAYVWRGGNRLH